MFGFPRWLIVASVILIGIIEVVGHVPDILLTPERYVATKAELAAKAMQAKLMTAQVQKAENDAAASRYQADMALAQLTRAKAEALASMIQPELSTVQLQKTKLETLAAAYQPKLSELQAIKLGIDTKVAGVQLPVQEQAAALSNATLTAMSPLMKTFLGMVPGAGTEPSQAAHRSPDPSKSQAYNDGMGDRQKLVEWTASLSGDSREGADFWAGVRTAKTPHTCKEGKGATSNDFRRACEAARDWFKSVDERRNREQDYRDGFNGV